MPHPALHSGYILVVDDHEDSRELLVELLEAAGMCALGAKNGADAFRVIESIREKPILIVLDLVMPVMNGEQFRALQVQDQALSSVPTVMLTGYDDVELARRLDVPYLIKPVDAALLCNVAKRCHGIDRPMPGRGS